MEKYCFLVCKMFLLHQIRSESEKLQNKMKEITLGWVSCTLRASTQAFSSYSCKTSTSTKRVPFQHVFKA